MKCLGADKGITQLREHSLGASYLPGTQYEETLRSTLPGIRACHETSTLAHKPGHMAGIALELKLTSKGTVKSIEHQTENEIDPKLVECILALFKPLRFSKPNEPDYGEVRYTVSFTTLRASRSIDVEAAELCEVARKMKEDPSWPRDKVLMETAVRFEQTQPSAAIRGLMDSLASAPRDTLYGTWRAGLQKLGVQKPDCPALEELWQLKK